MPGDTATETRGRNWRRALRRTAPGLLITWVLPPIVFALIRGWSGNDGAGLAIAGCIPALRALIVFVWRRRVDAIGLLGVAGFGAVLVVYVLSGGSTLLLKIGRAPLTGAIGLILLVAVAIGRPIMPRAVGRFFPRGKTSRLAVFATGLFGATLLTGAIVHIILVLALDTGAYVAVNRPVSWAINVGALAVFLLYLRWSRPARKRRDPGAAPTGTVADGEPGDPAPLPAAEEAEEGPSAPTPAGVGEPPAQRGPAGPA